MTNEKKAISYDIFLRFFRTPEKEPDSGLLRASKGPANTAGRPFEPYHHQKSPTGEAKGTEHLFPSRARPATTLKARTQMHLAAPRRQEARTPAPNRENRPPAGAGEAGAGARAHDDTAAGALPIVPSVEVSPDRDESS